MMGLEVSQYLLKLVEGLAAGKQSPENIVRNEADDTIMMNKGIISLGSRLTG